MNRFHVLLLVFTLLVSILYSCSKSSLPYTQNGNWIYRGDFVGAARSEAVVFVIGNYAYIGTGIDNNFNRYNDLWQLQVVGDSCVWFQLASAVNMVPRNSAVAFTINGQGYVGTGTNGAVPYSDFWQYNPTTNQWNQIASVGDSATGFAPRVDAVAFGIQTAGTQGMGYVGTGNNLVTYLKDFWAYDPSTNAWSAEVSFNGYKRTAAVSFVYKNCGYLTTGLGTSGASVSDFWKFDPSQPDSSKWTELRHIQKYSTETYDNAYTTIIRYNAVSFVLTGVKSDGGGDKAYVTTGINGPLNDNTWEYDFATDLWVEKTPFVQAARQGAVGFSLQNRGFVALGIGGSANFQDVNEFLPDEVYNSNQN
jgi:N-acetylneuraminic acid mutarotase